MFGSSISVRGLAAALVACALLCLGAANASAAPLVWASNFGEDTVSTVDSVTGQAVGTPIPVPAEPESIAITPNGRRALVVSDGKSSAALIETAARKPVKTFEFGSAAGMVAISPDGRTGYVTLEAPGEIAVVNPETATLAGSFPVGAQPRSVAFSPDGSEAFVGLGTGSIAIVDTATEEVVGKSIPIGGVPTSIVFSPDGKTAYATSDAIDEVQVIDVARGEVVKSIPVPSGSKPHSLAVSPDGRHVYLGSIEPPSLSLIETAQNQIVGKPIPLTIAPYELAVTPDGSTALVAGGEVVPVNLLAGRTEPSFGIAGHDVHGLAVAPDQSPTAAFTAPTDVTPGTQATFSGAASADPDGTIASWSWAFGDGGTGTGISATHTYGATGTYAAKLSVVDNEGCGGAQVFTGRTAYCSGNVGASVTHPVTVAPPVIPIAAPAPPSNSFRFGRIVHNLRNGTVRIQVTLPSAGFVLLFGNKVHAVTRKSSVSQTMWLTLHARVELAKRLKTTLRAPVRFRVTFTPNGGTPKTVHRSVTLLRAPRHKH
ncbi:MAG: PKD domain-containing protein [Actinobacteria bacterium]|nr:PKD domain-containing protein [Actinomycetota bacterium]